MTLKKPTYEAQLRAVLARLGETDDGVFILRHIMRVCGFHSTNVRLTPNGIDKDAMLYHEAQRNIYLALRRFIKTHHLSIIEKTETETPPDEKAQTAEFDTASLGGW